jgi:hypothetical protein
MGRRRRRPFRPRLLALATALAAFGSMWFLPGTAHASMSGPCTAQVNGQDVSGLSSSSPGDAIDVGESDKVTVAAQSSAPVGEYRIQLEYAGIRWTVAKGQATNNRWTREVEVKDYARYGSGLYRLHGVSDGAASCDGAVLINVDGNPLTTPLGIAGVVFVALGVANAVALVRGGRQGVVA